MIIDKRITNVSKHYKSSNHHAIAPSAILKQRLIRIIADNKRQNTLIKL